MRCPQFSVRTLLWLMALVGAFFAGRESGWNAHRQKIESLYTRAWTGYNGTPARLEKLLESAARNREKQLTDMKETNAKTASQIPASDSQSDH